MNDDADWNLTHAELDLLNLMANERDHSTEHLFANSRYKETTIKSMCQDIQEKMGVHSRACAVAEAIRHGLVRLLTPEEVRERERQREEKQVSRENHLPRQVYAITESRIYSQHRCITRFVSPSWRIPNEEAIEFNSCIGPSRFGNLRPDSAVSHSRSGSLRQLLDILQLLYGHRCGG